MVDMKEQIPAIAARIAFENELVIAFKALHGWLIGVEPRLKFRLPDEPSTTALDGSQVPAINVLQNPSCGNLSRRGSLLKGQHASPRFGLLRGWVIEWRRLDKRVRNSP